MLDWRSLGCPPSLVGEGLQLRALFAVLSHSSGSRTLIFSRFLRVASFSPIAFSLLPLPFRSWPPLLVSHTWDKRLPHPQNGKLKGLFAEELVLARRRNSVASVPRWGRLPFTPSASAGLLFGGRLLFPRSTPRLHRTQHCSCWVGEGW